MTTIVDDEENQCISIEEYRNIKLTPEEEWNILHNPKRISIEALQTIEIKKRGKGAKKKNFNLKCEGPGPYYDPYCNHVHVWKNKKLIKNFIGEQFQNVPYIQYTENKPGIYCSICHCRNTQFNFKSNYNLDDKIQEDIPVFIKTRDFSLKEENKTSIYTNPEPKTSKLNLRIHLKWKTLVNKLNYSLNHDKIVDNFSKTKSVYLWPWQLTAYQKFTLNQPEYKSSCISVKSDIDKFRNDYAIII